MNSITDLLLTHIRRNRIKFVLWLLPLAVVTLFMYVLWQPLIKQSQFYQSEVAQYKQKVYQKAWLDSVAEHGLSENFRLQEHWKNVSARVVKNSSQQFLADSVRHLLDKFNLEVERLQVLEEGQKRVQGQNEIVTPYTPNKILFKIYGKGNFADYLKFLNEIKTLNIPLYINELFIRKQAVAKNSGIQFSMNVWIHITFDDSKLKKFKVIKVSS